ncbi:hypothetical protein HK102_007187, partial [Quaeritorhiza haematococci]
MWSWAPSSSTIALTATAAAALPLCAWAILEYKYGLPPEDPPTQDASTTTTQTRTITLKEPVSFLQVVSAYLRIIRKPRRKSKRSTRGKDKHVEEKETEEELALLPTPGIVVRAPLLITQSHYDRYCALIRRATPSTTPKTTSSNKKKLTKTQTRHAAGYRPRQQQQQQAPSQDWELITQDEKDEDSWVETSCGSSHDESQTDDDSSDSTTPKTQQNKQVPPFYLLSIVGPLQLLLLSHPSVSFPLLGSLNLRNAFKFRSAAYDGEGDLGPLSFKKLKAFSEEGKLLGECSVSRVQNVKRGTEVDVLSEVVVEGVGVLWSCTFT